MKDGAAILKILSVQTFVFQNMIKSAFYRQQICEYELKNSLILAFFFFCQIQLVGLIEENLDLGPTTDRQVLKSTYLHKTCLNNPH